MVVSFASSLATWGAAAESIGGHLVLQDVSTSKCHRRRHSSSSLKHQHKSRPSAATTAVVCGLFVVASARCRPRAGNSVTRSLRFETSIARSRCRRRRGRRGNGTGGEDDDIWGSSSWDDVFGVGGGDDGGSDGGSGGSGSGWGPGSGSSGDAFHKAVFECMWVWQLMCAMSMLHSWYFLLFPDQGAGRFEAHNTAADIMPARLGVAY